MITVKPIVLKRDGEQRHGRGFSREELKKAGLNLREALKLDIPVDSRRKTAHKENINTLRRFLKRKKKKSKPKKRKKSKS